jgi:hypothetical protein
MITTRRSSRLALVALLLVPPAYGEEKAVELKINVDDAAGQPVPCRIHLLDAEGKPQRAESLPFWKDHFTCSGRVNLHLAPGRYRYEIERGPEHQRLAGSLELQPGRDHTLHAQLGRFVDLARRGWYAGDLHIHRSVEEIELLMRAEDLYIGPVITWWNANNQWKDRPLPREPLRRFDGNRFTHLLAGEDERGGGALLYFHLDEPLAITRAAREHPPALAFALEARKNRPGVWIDIEKPFWWDAPAWMAHGATDSIGIANNHMCRKQMYANEAWGRARDEKRFPPPLGNGRWTQQIYYHALECGLRLPPSAGSASGVLPNPVGYNRVYVQVEGELTWAKWWAGLKAGRSFVTNGPLLLVTADGKPPGHVFQIGKTEGKDAAVKLDLLLQSLDRVPALEIVRNGEVVQTIPVTDSTSFRSEAALTFNESGWFLVRAVADNKETFRFASTAPFYIEAGKQPRRMARKSVRFFLDWMAERAERLKKALPDEKQRNEVLKTHDDARRFWSELLERATVE